MLGTHFHQFSLTEHLCASHTIKGSTSRDSLIWKNSVIKAVILGSKIGSVSKEAFSLQEADPFTEVISVICREMGAWSETVCIPILVSITLGKSLCEINSSSCVEWNGGYNLFLQGGKSARCQLVEVSARGI